MAEKALIELGYEVENFHMDEKFWKTSIDVAMGLVANGSGAAQAEDLLASCETVLPSI